jgi:tRNA dimethylallyltransferase
MKRRTRNYAKRQLTWMRKLPEVLLLDATGRSADDVAAELHAALREATSAGAP